MNYSKMARRTKTPTGDPPKTYGTRYVENYNNNSGETGINLNFTATGATGISDKRMNFLNNSNTIIFQNALNDSNSTTINIRNLRSGATGVDKVILNFDGKNTYDYNVNITNQLNGLTIQNASTFPTSINNNVTELTFKGITEGAFPDLSGLTGVNGLRLENINIPDLEIQNLPDSINQLQMKNVKIKKLNISNLNLADPSKIIDKDNVISKFYFCQEQNSALCGMHALNNLLQKDKFIHDTTKTEDEIIGSNNQLNMWYYAEYMKNKTFFVPELLGDKYEYNESVLCEDSSPCAEKNGWYSFDVIRYAINKTGKFYSNHGSGQASENVIDIFTDDRIKEIQTILTKTEVLGIIFNHTGKGKGSHYSALTRNRFNNNYYWYLDSQGCDKDDKNKNIDITNDKVFLDEFKEILTNKSIKQFIIVYVTPVEIIYNNITYTPNLLIKEENDSEEEDEETEEETTSPPDQTPPPTEAKSKVKFIPKKDLLDFGPVTQLFNCFNQDKQQYEEIVEYLRNDNYNINKILFIFNGAYYCSQRDSLEEHFTNNTLLFGGNNYYNLPYKPNTYIDDDTRKSIREDIDKAVFYTFEEPGQKMSDGENGISFKTAQVIGINVEGFMKINFKSLTNFRDKTTSSETFYNYLSSDNNNIVVSDNSNFYQMRRNELLPVENGGLVNEIPSDDNNDYSGYRYLNLMVIKYVFKVDDLETLYNTNYKMFYFKPTEYPGFYEIMGYTMDDINNIINESSTSAMYSNLYSTD